LTRQVNSKHGNTSTKGHITPTTQKNDNIPLLTKEDLSFIVDKVKTKITEDGFWDSEMTSIMASVYQTIPCIIIYCQFISNFVTRKTR
jgi:hypothetical protein